MAVVPKVLKHHASRCLALLLVLGMAAITAGAQTLSPSATSPSSEKTTRYLQAIADSLGEPATGTLARIAGTDRQLLAARSYLRGGSELASRWSWPQDQIEHYPQTDEYRAAMTEIDKVKAQFALANPGYELYVNVQARSLDLQLERWNDNASVAVAAQATLSVCETELATASYPEMPDAAARRRFAAFLLAWYPDPPPNLAAPGLSPHGQSRAYDFQIRKDGQLVAGTDSSQIATVWNAEGWRTRLADAVTVGSTHFQGPLAFPDEPWHYQYTP